MSENLSTDLTLYDFNANINVSWGKGKKQIEFLKEAELNDEVLTENTWLIPERWNQGCYDAVQILGNNGIRLKLCYIVIDTGFNSKSRNSFGYTFHRNTHRFYHPNTGNLGRYRQFLQPTDEVVWYGLYRTV
jgi:hypothetical protein